MTSTETSESKYRSIVLEQRQVTVIAGDWPRFTQISLKMLCEKSVCRVTAAGKIEIKVHNGWAIYRLTEEQVSEYYVCLELEEEGGGEPA